MEDCKNKYYQVAYLHHLPLEDKYPLGDFIIWPYRKWRKSMVKDGGIRTYLDKYFSQMYDYLVCPPKPLKHIAIISKSQNYDFAPLSDADVRGAQAMLNGLFFCCLPNNASGHLLGNLVSSDNFNLTLQNFNPESEGWAVEAGSLFPSRNTFSSECGIRNAAFNLPAWVPRPKRIDCDAELLKSLALCLTKNNSLSERIFAAIRWVTNAYTNTDLFPHHNRIILLMIAFEILADRNSREKGLNRHSFAA